MKHAFLIWSILIVILLGSCKKDPGQCMINTGEIIVQRDGSVWLRGSIPENSAKNCKTGFCYSSAGIPERKNNTMNIDATTYNQVKIISAELGPGFNPNLTYYFRTWTSDDKITTYGKTVELPAITPIHPGDCARINTVDVSLWDRIYSYSYDKLIYSVSDGHTVIQSYTSNDMNVQITFGPVLKEGVYKTVKGFPKDDKSVAIGLKPGFPLGPYYSYLDEGSDVTVIRIRDGVYEINACAIHYMGGNTKDTFSTRLWVYASPDS